MDLPDDAIGITDIEQHRACPRRFNFGMRRHTPAGEHPEATSRNTAYGSAMHDCYEALEAGDLSDDEAIQETFKKWSSWLDPEHLTRLREDIATYRLRDYTGVRTVMNEGEIRVPLMVYKGRQIYFRGRIDRLYQRLDNPGVFLHIDYKSTAWEKSQGDVDTDRQLWAYNWAIHEVYPEVETLVQVYDQLSYGAIRTSKSDIQREEIHAWLQLQAFAVLENEDYDETDGLLKPKFNQWCPYCEIRDSCTILGELTSFARDRIAVLAPTEKIGRKSVVHLDPDLFEVYVDQLDDVKAARLTLEAFEKAVQDALKEMPAARRRKLGYDMRRSSTDVWTAEALRQAHDLLGDRFYGMVSMTKTAVEKLGDQQKQDLISGFTERRPGAARLRRLP